jgi:hypothetical protein
MKLSGINQGMDGDRDDSEYGDLRANLPSSYPYQRRGNSYDLFGSGKKGSDVDMKAWSSLGNRDDRDLI